MIGKNIKRALERQGKTQRKLAEDIGITEASVSKYIHGDRVPKATVLAKIADALGVTTDQLISGEENPFDLMRLRISNQEAAEMIRNDLKLHHDSLSGQYRRALNMAISALQAQDSPKPTAESVQNVQNEDLISRKAAIDAVDYETVSTNPEHFKSSEKFIKFMDDADISSFGKWQWANGFNTALVATTIQLKKLPSAQPEQRWIPVSKKLPEVGRSVLFSRRSMGTREGCLQADGKWWQYRWNEMLNADQVTAWKSLPEPYRAERRTDDL